MTSLRRKVRFAEEQNATFHLEERELAHHDRGCTAFQKARPNNWRQMELAARSMKQTGYGILLRDSFGGSDEVSIQQNLNAFAQSEHGRGLERHLSHQHDEERDVANDRAIRAVLGMQTVLRAEGTPSQEMWTSLAYTLELHAEAAKTFARRVGCADQLAASEQDSNTPIDASCLVKQMLNSNARKSVRRPSVQDILDDLDFSDSTNETEDESDGFSDRSNALPATQLAALVRTSLESRNDPRVPQGVERQLSPKTLSQMSRAARTA